MLEALKSSKQTVRVLLVLVAMVAAIMAASAMSNSPSSLGSREAEASHVASYTTIKGTVIQWNLDYSASTRGAYYNVYLYRWNGSSWSSSPVKTTTANSYGQYAFYNVPKAHYYYVYAHKAYGDCWSLGYYEHYDGNTNAIWIPTTSTGVNATVNTSYYGRAYC